MNNCKLGILALTLCVVLPAHAESMYSVDYACPIGGKKFKYLTTGTSQTWGQRPDGKTYADWPDPMPLPVCPDNGLVVFADFSKAEIKKLRPLIASSEYQSMRRTEAEYYLAYWLKGRLEVRDVDRVWTVMQASWQVDDKPDLKRRYQSEFVDVVSTMAKPPDVKSQIPWVNLQARRVNALRELGQFEGASAALESILVDTLQNFPEPPKDGNMQPAVDGKSQEEIDKIGAGIVRAQVGAYLDRQRSVIARRDSSAEPFDMLPIRIQASSCIDERHENDALFKSVCSSESVKQRIDRMRRLNLPTYRP